MATVILVRHGRTTANASGMLAGRMRGVRLDDVGVEQARRTGERLAAVPLAAVVSSPLERCRQTAKALLDARGADAAPALGIVSEKGITECDYGEWQGRPLKDLAKEPLWKVVQAQPSAAAFPGGESMATMQARSVAAVRRHDAALEAEHGAGAVWVAVSHGDIIKSVLADALGMHLDLFQRINVDPASVSIVRYTGARPYVLATNTHAGDLSWLVPPPPKRGRSRRTTTVGDDAPVGGGAGPSARP
jgi:probable phosphomutase (TIGR03848 family)